MKVFLIPPPELPIPAVKGGAVETLVTHLLEENEVQGKLELVSASIPDPEAQAQARNYTHSRVLYLPRPEDTLSIKIRRVIRRLKGCPPSIDPWYFAVEEAVKQEQPDFIIAEGGNLNEPALICRKMGREHSLFHLHGETMGSPHLAKYYGGGLILSDYVKRVFLEGCPIPAGKSRILPNCIDLNRFSPVSPALREEKQAELGYTPEDFVVIFCGRIAPDKGIHQLLEAMLEIPDPAIKLLIVGSPFFGAAATDPFMQSLKEKGLALGNRIQFTGYLPNQLLREYYGAADLSCVPSLCQEAAGLVAIEAMACGLPVVATQSGGMPEYLAGSESVLVDQGEGLVSRLARAITQLKADPERRARMSALGLETACRYGRPAFYETFVSHLEEFQKEC